MCCILANFLSVVGPCPEILHETKLKVRITRQETLLDSTAFRLNIAGGFSPDLT